MGRAGAAVMLGGIFGEQRLHRIEQGAIDDRGMFTRIDFVMMSDLDRDASFESRAFQ